jgi:myosin heavy subunit
MVEFSEKFQAFYLRNALEEELEIYSSEGLSLPVNLTSRTDFRITIYDAPGSGLLDLISEFSRARKTVSQFVEKLTEKHEGNSFLEGFDEQKSKSQPRLKRIWKLCGNHPFFCVRHFSEEVFYDPKLFFVKNSPAISDTVLSVVKESLKPEISKLLFHELVREEVGPEMKRRPDRPKMSLISRSNSIFGKSVSKFSRAKSQSIAPIPQETQSPRPLSKLRNDYGDLSSLVSSGNCWFVRCLRTSLDMTPSEFDLNLVNLQLLQM